jgi:hypothetical protein
MAEEAEEPITVVVVVEDIMAAVVTATEAVTVIEVAGEAIMAD